MDSGPLCPHQIAHHHVQDGRGRAAADSPEQVFPRDRSGGLVRAQNGQKAAAEQAVAQRKDHAAGKGAVYAESGAAADSLIVLSAQGPAHHAGAAHAEEVGHRVEGQQQRGRQGNGGVLYRVVEVAHKIGIRQVVKDHHQAAQDGGDGKLGHRLGNRHLFKKILFIFIVHCFIRICNKHTRCLLQRVCLFVLPLSGSSSRRFPRRRHGSRSRPRRDGSHHRSRRSHRRRRRRLGQRAAGR